MLKQKRLERFFSFPNVPSRQGHSILDLPQHLRYQIYSYFNLVQDGHIHLNVEQLQEHLENCRNCHDGNDGNEADYCDIYDDLTGQWCFLSPAPLPLLLVCRTFYQDVCAILYSRYVNSR